MRALPSGTVTFLFTDVEGSTRLLQQHPDAMKAALERHHALLRRRDRRARRRVFQVVGDGMCAAFAAAGDALAAALAAQRALFREPWGGIGGAARAHGTSHRQRRGARRRVPVLAHARAHAARGRRRSRRADAALDRYRGRGPRGAPGRRPRCATWARTSCAASPSRKRIFELVTSDLPSEFPPLAVEAAASSPSATLRELHARRARRARRGSARRCASSGTSRSRRAASSSCCRASRASARRASRRT